MATEDEKKKKKKLATQALATWARLKSAGKAPIAGKPYDAEVAKNNPDLKK
jgi:hypothetical protein